MCANLSPVPAEPLWEIFTPTVIRNLRTVQNPTSELQFRLNVLGAGGLNPSENQVWLRGYKAAWEVYLFTAFACGLFNEPHGADLRARLRGTDDANFRSAMSECFAAWFLAGRRKLRIEPRPQGQGSSVLEFVIKDSSGDINVEVKAPYKPLVINDPGEPPTFFYGDDADLLQGALREANEQFKKGEKNLLIVVPKLRLPIFDLGFRRPIERAFIGEDVIRIPIDPTTGGPAGPAQINFKQSGQFTKKWPAEPRFTRISAALFITGDYVIEGEVQPRALFLENPNTVSKLSANLWSDIPQYQYQFNSWQWSDEKAQ